MRLLIAALFAMLAAPVLAQEPPPAPAPDYTREESWACLPGRVDLCAVDLSATAVAADGTLTPQPFKADPNAAIDCFYVYPTVSNDRSGNSDMVANDEERYVVAQQFARFVAACRTYAPLYRQVTLTALRAAMTGHPMASADRIMAYLDVKDAWETYLKKYNKGRGVILIGHSQGAGILTSLIAREIDGKAAQSRLVAAYILGSNIVVPRGKTVGGVFSAIPLCTSADQTGCVVSYVSFRDRGDPPAAARFGTTEMSASLHLPANIDPAAACVNPAALLAGNEPAPANAYFAAGRSLLVEQGAQTEWAKGKTVTTPFVTLPGLITTQCKSNPTHTWLAVSVHGNPADPRIDDIPGDVVVRGEVQADWGLHLIDVNEEIGDLVALAQRQGAAWERKKR